MLTRRTSRAALVARKATIPGVSKHEFIRKEAQGGNEQGPACSTWDRATEDFYAKGKEHARTQHRKEGLRVGSRSRSFLVFSVLYSFRILHTSPITKKTEAKKAPYPCLLISPAHMELKNESKPKESRAEQGNETLKMQGRWSS